MLSALQWGRAFLLLTSILRRWPILWRHRGMNPKDIPFHGELKSPGMRVRIADPLHIVYRIQEILGGDLHIVPAQNVEADIHF